MTTNETQALAHLLTEASAAHNEYEQRELAGVYDQGWPGWYAAYLVEHRIGGLLNEDITAETLSTLLTHYDNGYRAQERQESWPEYYAAQLLERRNNAGKSYSN